MQPKPDVADGEHDIILPMLNAHLLDADRAPPQREINVFHAPLIVFQRGQLPVDVLLDEKRKGGADGNQ